MPHRSGRLGLPAASSSRSRSRFDRDLAQHRSNWICLSPKGSCLGMCWLPRLPKALGSYGTGLRSSRSIDRGSSLRKELRWLMPARSALSWGLHPWRISPPLSRWAKAFGWCLPRLLFNQAKRLRLSLMLSIWHLSADLQPAAWMTLRAGRGQRTWVFAQLQMLVGLSVFELTLSLWQSLFSHLFIEQLQHPLCSVGTDGTRLTPQTDAGFLICHFKLPTLYRRCLFLRQKTFVLDLV